MKTSDRMQQLMSMPVNQVPWKAIALAKFLSSKYGRCGEVYCHAYSLYAKVIEGTEGGDSDEESERFLLSLSEALCPTNHPHEENQT
jgi:hypothetical protein